MGHRLHRPQSSQARTQADSVRGVAVGRWRGLNKAGGVTNQVTPHPIHHRAWPMSIRHDNLDRLLGAAPGARTAGQAQRTGIVNQIRAFLLERGIAVRQGPHFLRTELPGILGKRSDVLSPRMMRIIEDLAGDWRRLDERIEGLSTDIRSLVEQDPACERLMTVPGIGPIISSATVAAIGTGDVFSKGRDFAAWLGLVPRQISTGDRTILGKISKRGNRYLRVLFVQAAWVVLIRPQSWERYGLKP